MLYSKPPKKTYTQLCIEFDNEFYTPDRDDSKLFSYLYLIFYMLACKKDCFHGKKYEKYDEFAAFAATVIYTRFMKKEKEGERIKSVLNYAKSSLQGLIVMYQNDSFNEVVNPELDNFNEDNYSQLVKNSIEASYRDGIEDDIINNIRDFPVYIKETIDETPYRTDKVMSHKLYISCLLTLSKSFTFTQEVQNKLNNKGMKLKDEHIYKFFNKQKDDSVSVWFLDENMSDYITVLCNKIKMKFTHSIEDIKASYRLEDSVVDAILQSTYIVEDDGTVGD